jgi:hypothetical protein
MRDTTNKRTHRLIIVLFALVWWHAVAAQEPVHFASLANDGATEPATILDQQHGIAAAA